MKMRYQIRPYIHNEDSDLVMFFTELHQMTPSEIQDGINTCNIAINEGKSGFSWGLEVFELLIEKENSTLEYHGEFVAEIPTKEILKMLQDYKDALDYFERKV